MDAEQLRELQIATKKAEIHYRQTVAAGKPAGMAAESYQMLYKRLQEAKSKR